MTKEMTKKKWFLLIISILLLLAVILVVFQIWPYLPPKIKKQEDKIEISQEEKAKIEEWLLQNNLNQYSDPQGTFYTGGTPLFDEATGKTIDRYQYILNKHPDRPWNK